MIPIKKIISFIHISATLLIMFLILTGHALALQIATINASTGNLSGSWGASWQQVNFSFYFGDVLLCSTYPSPGGPLHEVYLQQEGTPLFNYTLTPAHIGQTINLSGGGAFDSAVSYLTNGINEGIHWEYWIPNQDSNYGPSGVVSYQFESALFHNGVWWGDTTGLTGVDLQGFHISNIALQINNIQVETPGQNPNGDGLWTDYQFDLSVVIAGEANPVPEPTTLLLLGSGLMTLMGWKKIFRK